MPGGVRLSGGPVLSETEISTWESEISSVISIGDRCLPSESEDEFADKQKYQLPDAGKTRLNLLTKEPLSPSRTRISPSLAAGQYKMAAAPSTPRLERPPSQRQPSSPYIYRGYLASSENINAVSDSEYFTSDLSRAGSVYSLSRVSFAGQIAQLTSLKLPDAASLTKKISSIPTASEAARALSDASEQIKLWIGKACEVLQGLNADDDVEWAAAGGRDGIEEVDQAIKRFEKLVDVYVLSIEKLQTRDDAAMLSPDELKSSVKQMEAIIASWAKIKETLRQVRAQVQLAIDWEGLWNTDLGEVAQDLRELSRHIFEMEEKRHQGVEQLFATSNSMDLNELESILEEQPKAAFSDHVQDKLVAPDSPLPQLASFIGDEEAALLGLSARMQPLRTSLDFLPMKLSAFSERASTSFPTACKELEDRRGDLEEQWTRLEDDAKALRSELGEDKWVTVFRNAGNQASKMCDSVGRTLSKLKTALDSNEQVLNRSSLTRKTESYDAKKLHYAPAIDRVLAIIDRGVQDRLTINGDILRHQMTMRRRWVELQSSIKVMDSLLGELNIDKREKHLRDSVSTIMSSERSLVGSLLDTPGTSPASSVIGASRKSSFQGCRTPTQAGNTAGLASTTTPSTASRTSSHKLSTSIPRRSSTIARSSVADFHSSPSPAPASSSSSTQWPNRSLVKDDQRPKWNASTKADKRDFAPLSKFEPSPYAKKTVAPPRTQAHKAQSGVGSRVVSEPLRQSSAATESRVDRRSGMLDPITPQRRDPNALRSRASSSRLSLTPMPAGRCSRLGTVVDASIDGNDADIDVPARSAQRPASSLDRATRRTSVLAMRPRAEADQIPGPEAGKPKWR